MLPWRSGKDFLKYINPVLAAVEIGRRTMWACLRLENEHLHNTENYRSVAFIPLYFDPPDDDADKKEKTNMQTIVEISCFVIVVVALGVVAVCTKD